MATYVIMHLLWYFYHNINLESNIITGKFCVVCLQYFCQRQHRLAIQLDGHRGDQTIEA